MSRLHRSCCNRRQSEYDSRGCPGPVLAGIVAFVLEYADDTIKSGEDVERFIVCQWSEIYRPFLFRY